MRYVITVRVGKRVLEKHTFNDYYAAMDMMDFIERTKDKMYSINAIVEFKDTDPFNKG